MENMENMNREFFIKNFKEFIERAKAADATKKERVHQFEARAKEHRERIERTMAEAVARRTQNINQTEAKEE